MKKFRSFKARCLQSISNLEKVLWERGMQGGSYDIKTELRKIVKEEPQVNDDDIQHEEKTYVSASFVDVLGSEESAQAFKDEESENEAASSNHNDFHDHIETDEDEVINEDNETIEENLLEKTKTVDEKIETITGDDNRQITWKKFVEELRHEYPTLKKFKRDETMFESLDVQCEVCNEPEIPDLLAHIKKVHFSQNHRTFFCMCCREKFLEYPGLNHFDIHRKFKYPRQCSYCAAKFDTVFDLKRHLDAHFFTGTGAICKCGQQFPKVKDMQMHIARQHLNRIVCKHCSNVFIDTAAYKSHKKVEKLKIRREAQRRRRQAVKNGYSSSKKPTKRRSSVTKVTIASAADKKLPFKERIPLKERISYCSICNINIHDILNHIVEVHFTISEDEKYQCTICESKTNSNLSARAHFNNKHRLFEVPEACPTCDMKFLSFADYKKHIAEHKNQVQEYECDHCKTHYTTKASLRYHLIANHSSNKICKYCMKEFDDEAVFAIHIKEERQKRTTSIHVCDICGFGTRHKRYLQDHISRRHGNQSSYVECDECGKPCKSLMNLKDHKLNKHREKTIACEICGRKQRNNALLKEHIKVAHPTKKVNCEICAKLVNPILMKRHRFLAHSAARPHQCRVCTMTFKTKGVLLKHLHSHGGTRPYNCTQCDNGYYTRALLSRHYLQTHNHNYSDAEMRTLAKRMPSALELEERAELGQM